MLYSDFFNMISDHIVDHIFKVMPISIKPIKYTILMYENNHIFNVQRILSELEIYLPNTIEKTKSILQQEVNRAIYAQEYTDHDWIHPEDNIETLTIIQERLTIPPYCIEPDPNENQIKLAKTFKEDISSV